MGLPWVRLDTQFASNPKILYLIEDKQWRSIVVWAAGLAYAGVPRNRRIHPKISPANLPRHTKKTPEI